MTKADVCVQVKAYVPKELRRDANIAAQILGKPVGRIIQEALERAITEAGVE